MDFLIDYFKDGNGQIISGLTNELTNILIINKFKKEEDNIIVLTSTLFEANRTFENLKTYTDDVFLFPMDDFLTTMILAVSPELEIKRLETLENIKKNKKSIVVTNLMGYLKFLPDAHQSSELSLILEKEKDINQHKLIELLEQFGYIRQSLVTSTGEYALRGFVVDIFPAHEEHPFRLEYFGNKIESIRYFDELTQISTSKIDSIILKPYKEVQTACNSSLFDYLNNPRVIYLDYEQIKISYDKLWEDVNAYAKENKSEPKEYMYHLEDIPVTEDLFIESLIDNTKSLRYETRELVNFNSNFSLLSEFVSKCLRENKTVIFCLSKDNQIKEIKELFPLGNISREIILSKVNIIKQKINKGFIIDKYVVISEFDIENVTVKPINYKNTYHLGRKIKGFSDLQSGDYVVHVLYGIGIYRGVITLTKNKVKKDYLQIDYADNDKVYIPVEKIEAIYKYTDKDGSRPQINKLGTTTWEKRKRVLRGKIADISKMLLELYAKREKSEGIVFKSFVEEELFGSEFIYTATKDQLIAIEEVGKDLENIKPMDRLLCGDVGFGKTEVAFRAMFKTVMNNHQVLYLCPTTILSKQQYTSALERFRRYPINIGLLNRFTTKKETTRIIEELKKGSMDIVFGTHRLLSNDVKPKNLGLLVVDEEQRFGVTHKEKIKNLKKNVNVLTLSATPIPRTLKMAVSGIRDLSLIDTAPVDRYPIQTYVMAESDYLIKEAIYKELARNGQVFILNNRIETLEEQHSRISRLVPEARIVTANGQMSKIELENVMLSFIKGESDVLICTTIIETGIDIPNVNTLIVFNADYFGLSQLYQIRGRVGRSNKIAYAYLMYQKNKILNDDAIKRLQAIREFTELGSGYKIAMKDLSIRGSGDIFGSEQAGFISSVGIELYMKMIEDEIKRQKGEEVLEEEKLDKPALLNVETHISDSYVSDEEIKIEIHKKVNEINNYDMFSAVKEELEDRFGKIPHSIVVYMYEQWFENLANSLNITKVNQTETQIVIELAEELTNKISMDELFISSQKISMDFRFKYLRKRLIIALPIIKLERHYIYYLVALLEVIKKKVE